jgi:hypothetical protein
MVELFLLAILGLSGTLWFSDDASSGEEPDPDGNSQSTEHVVSDVINISEVGVEVEGTSGDDTIIIDGQNQFENDFMVDIFGDSGFVFDSSQAVTLHAGNGDDIISVVNGAAEIFTGDGTDYVNASRANGGLIHAGLGDTVVGTDIAYDGEFAVNSEGAHFQGGMSNEYAAAIGDGTSTLSGGGGDDFLVAFSGNAILDGGEGDDYLSGIGDDLAYCQCTRVLSLENYSNSSIDTVSGGPGDDVIEISNGDVASGGEGHDRFDAFFIDRSQYPDRVIGDISFDAPKILDFQSGEDIVRVFVKGGLEWRDPSDYDLSQRIEVFETDGNTYITIDGKVVSEISGAVGLRIGYQDPDSILERPARFVDVLSKEGGTTESFDVLVMAWNDRSS